MTKPRLLSYLVKPVLIIGGAVVVYSGVGFYAAPALLKAKLPQLIREAIGRDAAVADIQFNPFKLQFSLQGFELKESNSQPFVSFDKFYVDLDAVESIKQSAVVINDIQLQKPFVRLARQTDGKFNFSDLVKADTDQQPSDSQSFPVSVIKLAIAEGKLSWEDANQKEDVIPLNFNLENFSTQPENSAKLSLSLALSSGGNLEWQGSFALQPLQSAGHLKLDGVKLARVIALAGLTLPADIQGSELIEADYQLSQADKKLKLLIKQSNIELRDVQVSAEQPGKILLKTPFITLQADAEINLGEGEPDVRVEQGKLALRDFQFSEPGADKPLVTIPKLALTGLSADLKKHDILLDALTANGANAQAWLNADGVINYQALFAGSSGEPQPQAGNAQAAAEPASSPWNIKVNSIALNNFGLDFTDKTLKKPVAMSAKPINLQLSNVSNQDGTAIPFQVSVGINNGGLIKLDGNTTLQPFALQTALAVDGIALDKFQPYVDKFARLDIISGQFGVTGKLALKQQQDKLAINFTGNTGIAKLLTRDQLKNKDFVKWDNLTLQDVDVDVLGNTYKAKKLLINKPYARVVIRKDKTSNFSDILLEDKPAPKSAKVTTKAPSGQATKPPSFKLDSLQIVDGASDFADLSLILPFAAPIKSLDGGAQNFSSEKNAIVKVELKGNAYELSPVNVKGEISPYLGDYNVELNFIGMPMPLISPYMVQFAGYKVEKGKITLGLKYNVSKGLLTASNSILIDQFELGEKVDNPDAVSLPLELAVALMKDGDGKIKLDVPITGSLEDPQFSISHLVFDALVNSISKIITSPFRALASLVGSEADLSQIAFESGSAELKPEQQTKLSGLAKALTEKPELSVEIKGAVFQQEDWPSMQDDALYDQLKNIRSAEIAKEGGRKIRPEYVEISDEDYRRLMIAQFMEKFPNLAEKPLFGDTPKLLIPSKDDFYAVAKQKLSELIPPEPQRLKNLASERAQVIAKYLVQKGGIANERVFTLDTVIDPPRDSKELSSSLSLKVQ
ncbi:MAG: DUF748 domain-containing protein [Methylococcaceae bacterium]|nr:DUF748 domain-containing protein [Methylococcaceae bacterium]MDZ4156790.1 DUF748 domain-containing protein [Methylococcales bacterium]MDP2393306.1 DUF748 domain-containing protein [Methylococcaceae bacterium]MDP3018374.1 DUF748 domain-containing protein [Methylococcaceae bacterium]MDP3389316.1 DUF748 domain-containing protein [Methylococcaceae bacterium]